MQKPLLDLHTHTIVSGHAYSSLQEMVKAASEKGLKSIPGTCPLLYFKNMHVVPREMYGIKLLLGCEVNILDSKGSLDLNEEYLNRLDIGIAGIHVVCWKGGSKEENTEGVIKVMHNPNIHVICHPGDGSAELDFEQLVLASKETGTLLEINNHSMSPKRTMTNAKRNNLEILRLCKRYEVPLLLSSDAHISFQIADYERIWPLLEETEFPDELIMNYYPERVLLL